MPPIAELEAPATWRTVDFISDLHLHASEPETFAAWRRYLDETPADAVFMLGDLFEVWVGDDAADVPGFEADCLDVLRQVSARRALFFLHGNRDFLVGPRSMAAAGVHLLDDPVAIELFGQRWLLSHGDALCLDDIAYQKFRREVRSPAWQQNVLAQPLAARQQLARSIRGESEARKRSEATYADVDTPAARAWLQAAGARTLIHGHTHRPAEHDLGHGLRRIVLTDWDLAATPPRAEVLRLTAAGMQRLPLA
ncbi:UDP-2,3-diacylglucosamine diphosphatase [Rhodoferax koreense]|uniref:UDP-2,3-diacylglucosamine hydrolase n=1 Tax=Rhodoferax koreensis TaxID=1842727 RepID=A0A1P8JVT9_9BURK|nr:UDP-2,3-diacylglucosamine diphosphatase [Rhodoferax koreense]APW37863.1 UDP-2,3-diacylglucosamine diphosphatase [Rhodoferax koreense]